MVSLLNTQTISQLVDELPPKSITTLVLQALDFAVPGQWKRYPNFHDMAREITGEAREGKLQALCNHADQLYNGDERGAQRACWIYQSVDGTDRMLAATALAHQLGSSVGFLSFLQKLTPRPDTVQSLDLALKLTAEGLAYLNLHGLKGENFSEFEKSLSNPGNETAMRMAALVALDGILPLGPDFVSKVSSSLEAVQPAQIESNPIFARIGSMLPGASALQQIGAVRHLFQAVGPWMGQFSQARGLTQEGLLSRFQSVLQFSDGKLDTVASLLDASTNYLSYTGTQTAARHVIVKSWERFRPQ